MSAVADVPLERKVTRWQVTLVSGRVLYIYAELYADVEVRIPPVLPNPVSGKSEPTGAVLRIEPSGHVDAEGRLHLPAHDRAPVITDNRRAPGA